MNQRMDALRAWLGERDLPPLLISGPESRRYITGFDGSAGFCLVSANDAVLVVDGRYTDQAQAQTRDLPVVTAEGPSLVPVAIEWIRARGGNAVGFESAQVRVAELSAWQALDEDLQWVPVENAVETLRRVKDAGELDILREAAALADAAFLEILPSVRAGRREQDVALDFEFCMRRRGAEGLSFPMIVASGARSALPHGRASDKVMEPGDFVTFDYGVAYQGYCSDATRTLILGEPDARQREVYQTVLTAQRAAVAAVRAGVTGREVDRVARDLIDAAGYGEYFVHGLGHGLGMQVHEAPRLSPWQGEDPLEVGMVVSIEPGIYIPGWGGVRIEDVVIVTETGCESLTQVDKELVVNRHDIEQ